MAKHIVKSYDKELEHLNGKISDMGRIARMQLDTALEAFILKDTESAKKIVERDSVVDALEHSIHRLTVHLLASRQPMAIDLRMIISSLRIATDMERIADYVANIAKQVMILNGVSMDDALRESIIGMTEIARDMLTDILEAYIESDIHKALDVRCQDMEIDKLYATLFTKLRMCMMKDSQTVKMCTALLFVARCLERIGDHIKNVAEDIYFIVTGELYNGEHAEENEISIENSSVSHFT
jgi:phosphate transport system protein